MDLKSKIKNETILAMKIKDYDRLSLLRLISTFITNKEISLGIKGKEDLKDIDVISILKSMIKSRENVIEDYKKINDSDSIAKERAEIEIINAFLPKQYNEEETEDIIDKVIKTVNAQSIKDMGLVMKTLTSRDDSVKLNKSLVANIIKKKLS